MTKEKRIENFKELCDKMHFEISDSFFEWLNKNGFFTSPASTKYHGAYEGGLFDHSLAVTKRLIKLTVDNKLDWKRKESPFIVGMFHDLCKCDQYLYIEADYVGEPGHYEYNQNTLLKGHGSKSVMLLSQFINLTEEEMLCIRYHMGAYEKEEWPEFDTAIKHYENVLWTHQADMLASKVDKI
jgi:hypothetical protein